eukprot:c19928_g1_i1.p1 GENE.c19928_g1_i1~~c19928_g1_i1.p1  ORF type:complete len:924 (+),score=151.33 c19928_g1_i1:1146-3917(+)
MQIQAIPDDWHYIPFQGTRQIVLPIHIGMVQRIDFSSNGITDQGLKVFARYLEFNTTIHEIDFSHNSLTTASIMPIAAALTRNTTLKALYLNGNQFTRHDEEFLDCTIFGRGVSCDFSKSGKFGVGEQLQRDMIPLYSGWKSRLMEKVQEDRPTLDLDQADALQMLTWPIHAAVPYPQLLRAFLVELVALEQKSKTFDFIKSAQNLRGRTILHEAVEGGYILSVNHLLTTKKFNCWNQLRTRDADHLKPYMRALRLLSVTQDDYNNAADGNLSPTLSVAEREKYVAVSQENYELASDIVQELNTHTYVNRFRFRFARKQFLLSTLLYLIFILFGTLAAVNLSVGWNRDRHQFIQSVSGALLEQTFNNDIYQVFSDIGALSDMMDWINGPFTDAVWPDNSLTNSFFVNHDNRLLGAVRFRQIRTRLSKCKKIGALDQVTFPVDGEQGVCVLPWSKHFEDRAPIQGINVSDIPLVNDGSSWRSGHESGYRHGSAIGIGQSFDYYGGDGYILDIPSGNRTEAISILKNMADITWIDRQTRALMIEFNIYNPELKISLFGALRFTILPSSSVIPFSGLAAVPTERFATTTAADRTYMAFTIILVAGSVFYLVSEAISFRSAINLKGKGISALPVRIYTYLTQDWNIIDVLCLLLIALWLYFVVKNSIDSQHKFSDMESLHLLPELTSEGSDRFTFVNLGYLAEATVSENNWLALAIALYWLKLLKYITLSPGLGPVVSAIIQTMFNVQVLIFAVVLMIVELSFALGMTVSVGGILDSYKNFAASLGFLGFMTLGNYDLASLQVVAPEFGPIAFFVFLIIIGLVMLNIFIAVVSEVYQKELESSSDDWQDDLTDRMKSVNFEDDAKITWRELFGLSEQKDEIAKPDWSDQVRRLYKAYKFQQEQSNHVVSKFDAIDAALQTLKSKLPQ